MGGEEKKHFLDEIDIETVIPNYGNLTEDEKKKCLDEIYSKQSFADFSMPLGVNRYLYNQKSLKENGDEDDGQ